MKIIAKKVKGFYGNKNGLIRPIFEIDELQNIRPILSGEYPNSGLIFLGDYELLDNDISSNLFVMDNCFFISDDTGYHDRQQDNNACQKRINYNSRISSFFKDLTPNLYIPIYKNKFSFDTNRLISTDDIASKIFFLKTEKDIYGPFERDNYDLKAANFENYEEDFLNDNLYKDFVDFYRFYDGSVIFKITLGEASNFTYTDNEGFDYLENFQVFVENNIGIAMDITPISLLHDWAIDKLKLKYEKIANSLSQIRNIEQNVSSEIDKLKWNKYISHLTKIENDEIAIDEIVSVLNEKGFIGTVTDNSMIENIQLELQATKDDIVIKNDEIINLKNQKGELELQLKDIKNKEYSAIDASLYPTLSASLNSEEKLVEIEGILAENRRFETLSEDNKKLEYKKEFYEADIKKLEDDKRSITESVKLIKQNFDNDVSVHTAKLADAKMYTDLLNGINITPQDTHKDINFPSIKLTPLSSELNSAKAYIIEIQKRLKSQDRDLSFNETANLIITTNQSFITIIAGAPGVGKTSLVEKLSKSYGLNENFGYLEINCAKGWTSSKDLIGFFNPLTGKFQQAKTKLKDALEKSNANLNAPYIVLLDEANLSPMEHYWSDFIKLADNDYLKKIKISDKEEIRFGDGFRFVATINHDHTTEALSNRLIDRAAIIQLDKLQTLIENNTTFDNFETVYDYNELQKLFIETSKWKSDEELIKKFFNQIKERIESNNSGIIVSPRKEIAIRKFCRVATGLMEGNSYTALDYAVAQHILPLVSGRGEVFENSLKALRNDFTDKGMTKSEKLINKIIERGKELKHFRYIYY